jgi:hypothetical protein
MNLHKLVQPPAPRRPPPRIIARQIRDNGVIDVEYYGSTARFGTDGRGRYDPTNILSYEENRWPYHIISARTRTRPFTCPEGVTHTRYWTYGSRAGRYAAQMCEHTIGIDPLTGLAV